MIRRSLIYFEETRRRLRFLFVISKYLLSWNLTKTLIRWFRAFWLSERLGFEESFLLLSAIEGMLMILSSDFLDNLELLFFLNPILMSWLRKPFLSRMLMMTERRILHILLRHRLIRILLLISMLIKHLYNWIYCPIEVLTLQASGLVILCNKFGAPTLYWLSDIRLTWFFAILRLSSVAFIVWEVYSCSLVRSSVSGPLVNNNLAVARGLYLIVNWIHFTT